MADVTKRQVKRNELTKIAAVNAAATQTIVYDRSDENILVHVANVDAAAATVTFVAAGFGAGTLGNITVALAQNEEAVVVLESARFKAPATQKVTTTVTDADGTVFSGTITNVKFRVFDLPKALVD